MNNLSINAQTILAALKNQSIWEQQATDLLFPNPVYTSESQAAYWQHEANKYGTTNERPVADGFVLFHQIVPKSYFDITMEAVSELKAARLIEARNNGYNEYYYVKL
jgi:hypothetical protein